MGKFKFDKKAVMRDIISSGALDNISIKAANDKLKLNEAELISEFDNDEVSREIKDGPNASNSSGTLGGYGNLFSFIGFNEGSNPVGTVISYLRQKISITKNVNYRIVSDKRILVSVAAKIPNKEELSSITQIVWDTKSWLFGISTGISGISYYIRKMLAGRSEGGFQTRKKVRTATFKKQSYFSAMYRKFVKNLARTNNFK